MRYRHISAMPEEVIHYLNLAPGKIIVDGTIGGGGHAKLILRGITPGGLLIGIDQDIDTIKNAEQVLKEFELDFNLVHNNFANLPEILSQKNIPTVDGILLDIGLSQHQLEGSKRGFSFQKTEPLDMRMNIDTTIKAEDIVNSTDERGLSDIFFKFGEERFARQIARKIVSHRIKNRIKTSKELAEIVCEAVPKKAANKQRIHPATRVFQALRIAVNKELEKLEMFMNTFDSLLKPGGRLCILTFHSLEDRIVKHRIRELEKNCICPKDFPKCVCNKIKVVNRITRKVLTPKDEEIRLNPMARSTKMRVVEKI